jgi:hypothetical protein
VEEYSVFVSKQITQAAESILSLPSEEQTYENTLGAWNQLYTDLSQHFQMLHIIADSNSPSNETAYLAIKNLNAFLASTQNYPPLYRILEDSALRTLRDSESTSAQRDIAICFIKNTRQGSIELPTIPSQGYNNACDTDCAVYYLSHEESYQILLVGKNSRDHDYGDREGYGDRERKYGGSAETGYDIRWGDPDGIKHGAYFKGEAHDNKGNHAELEFRHNNEGKGRANIRAGRTWDEE